MKRRSTPLTGWLARQCHRRAVLLATMTCLILGCPGAPPADENQPDAVLGMTVGQSESLAAEQPQGMQLAPARQALDPAPAVRTNQTPQSVAPRVVPRDTSQVWYEAASGAHGTVASQGVGQPLRLVYETTGGAVQSQWTVRMMLTSTDPLTKWSQDLLGAAADAAIIAVQSYNYTGSPFPDPMTATFGPAPNLLVDAGGSTTTQVAPGTYTLAEFVLTYNFDGTDKTARSIRTEVGGQGWGMAGSTEAPMVQFGDNRAVQASADVMLGKAVILLSASGPPTITCPADMTVECDGSGNTAQLQAWLASATVTSTCPNPTVTNNFTALSDDCGATGSATVTWTATDDCGTATCSAKFTIVDTTPPVITLTGPAEMTLQCGVDTYTEAGATVTDTCDASLTAATVGGDTVDTHTPGVYVVTYNAKDACDNAATEVTRTVTVIDTLPPEVTVGEMKLLWPPNHQYVDLTLADCNVRVLDACAGELDVNQVGRILSIYSDEPENANGVGDGNTTEDIVFVGPAGLKLRAERDGTGNGRVYGIRFEVTDEAGNKTAATCIVGVPHDQSGDEPDDDGAGAGYTVAPATS